VKNYIAGISRKVSPSMYEAVQKYTSEQRPFLQMIKTSLQEKKKSYGVN